MKKKFGKKLHFKKETIVIDLADIKAGTLKSWNNDSLGAGCCPSGKESCNWMYCDFQSGTY